MGTMFVLNASNYRCGMAIRVSNIQYFNNSRRQPEIMSARACFMDFYTRNIHIVCVFCRHRIIFHRKQFWWRQSLGSNHESECCYFGRSVAR